jgi:hypothetical protein
VHFVSPAPGIVVTGDFLPIAFSLKPDAGRAIASRAIDYSLDGGETWTQIGSPRLRRLGLHLGPGRGAWRNADPELRRARLRIRVSDDALEPVRLGDDERGVHDRARYRRHEGSRAGGGQPGREPAAAAGRRSGDAVRHAERRGTGGGTVAAAEYSLARWPRRPAAARR